MLLQVPAHKALILYFQQSHLRVAAAVQLAAGRKESQHLEVLVVAVVQLLPQQRVRLVHLGKVLLVVILRVQADNIPLVEVAALAQ